MSARRVLVTGASGFVGAHLTAGFHAAGWDVLAGMRTASDPWRLHTLIDGLSAITRVDFELERADAFAPVLAGLRPDVVVHCAAYGVDQSRQDTARALACNAHAPARLVEAAAGAGVARFIHLGTACEYGDHRGPIAETTALRPRSLYAASKAAGSLLVLERAASLGLPLAVLRPFGLYGPLEGEHKLFPQLLHACRCGAPLDLSPGEQVRDYLHVQDLVRACVMAAEAPHLGSATVLNIGSGVGLSLRQIGRCVATLIGQGDRCLGWGRKPYRRGELMELVADAREAGTQLGWSAQIPLETGLRSMLAVGEPQRVSA